MSDWTPERIAEARARCEAATKGPWSTVRVGPCAAVNEEHADLYAGPPDGTGDNVACMTAAPEDAAFIAAAPSDLPAALDEIERLQRLVGMARSFDLGPFIVASVEYGGTSWMVYRDDNNCELREDGTWTEDGDEDGARFPTAAAALAALEESRGK